MKKNIFIFIITLILSFPVYAAPFQLISADIAAGKEMNNNQVLNNNGCHGKNISPELTWSNAPPTTKSFAVTLYDPDAPKGWWHWIIFNIPSSINKLEQNAGNPYTSTLPAGVRQGKNDFGVMGYSGPCPPSGDKPHRYIMTIYALKTTLPFDANTSDQLIANYIKQNEIAEASIMASYHR